MSILAISTDLTQAGLGVGIALLLVDRFVNFAKVIKGRNGNGDTGKLLATVIEKVDGQGRDIKELKRQLETHWAKYDVLREDATECKVALRLRAGEPKQ